MDGPRAWRVKSNAPIDCLDSHNFSSDDMHASVVRKINDIKAGDDEEAAFWNDRDDTTIDHLLRNSLFGLEIDLYPKLKSSNFFEMKDVETLPETTTCTVNSTKFSFDDDGDITIVWVTAQNAVETNIGFNALKTRFKVTSKGKGIWQQFLMTRSAMGQDRRLEEHNKVMQKFREQTVNGGSGSGSKGRGSSNNGSTQDSNNSISNGKGSSNDDSTQDNSSISNGNSSSGDLQLLSAEEEAQVESFLTTNGEEVCYRLFGADVARSSLQSLKPEIWVSDEAINLYFHILRLRDRQKENVMASTFFVPKLSVFTQQVEYTAVAKWFTEEKLGKLYGPERTSVFGFTRMLVPVHVESVHWALCVVNFDLRKIEYYDSLPRNFTDTAKQVTKGLLAWLQGESLRLSRAFDKSSWAIVYCVAPEQSNGFDCGIFMCSFAEAISQGRPPTYQQEQMAQYRRLMAWRILAHINNTKVAAEAKASEAKPAAEVNETIYTRQNTLAYTLPL